MDREHYDVVLFDWSLDQLHRLCGTAYGDKREQTYHTSFKEGERRIVTSPVVHITNGIAVTRSGTRYRLVS